MKNRRFFLNGMFVIAVTGTLTSCIDNSYDMSKDIDMTVGVGAQGLKLNIGNSEKIWLSDVLEVDEEEMLEETEAGLFYLVKSDNADFKFDVPSFKATVDVASLAPELPMLTFEDLASGANLTEYPLAKDWKTPATPLSVASTELLSISDLPKEIQRLKRIIPKKESKDVSVTLEIVSNTPSQNFVVESFEGVQINLPKFFKLRKEDGTIIENNVISIDDATINAKKFNLANFTIDALEFDGENGVDLSNDKSLDIEGHYSVSGNFVIKAADKFTLKAGDETTLRVTIRVGTASSSESVDISFAQVVGVFNPEINPNISPINIANDVPDFLTDPEVCIMASNPTFRLDVNLQDVPTNITMWGNLYAEKDGKVIADVRIPGEVDNTVELTGLQNSVIYFSGEEQPFDPNGVVEGAPIYTIANLGDVVKTIPDVIRVDMEGEKIKLTEGLTTISLGETYEASLDYDVYVPFMFNRGMKIVYEEIVKDLGGDLEDLAAEGAKVTATIENKVPLALELTAVLLDKNGDEIPGVEVSSVSVPALSENTVNISVKFDNPYDLQKLDQLSLKVKATTEGDNVTLTSEQFLQLKDLTFELLGQIIVDLN